MRVLKSESLYQVRDALGMNPDREGLLKVGTQWRRMNQESSGLINKRVVDLQKEHQRLFVVRLLHGLAGQICKL
jgi:hypothetical protein